MKIIIDNTEFYTIPNTPYCISTNHSVYNTKTHSYVSSEGSTIRLSINGSRSRYSLDKLLIDALLAHIDDIKRTLNDFI